MHVASGALVKVEPGGCLGQGRDGNQWWHCGKGICGNDRAGGKSGWQAAVPSEKENDIFVTMVRRRREEVKGYFVGATPMWQPWALWNYYPQQIKRQAKHAALVISNRAYVV